MPIESGWNVISSSDHEDVFIKHVDPDKSETRADCWRYCNEVYPPPDYFVLLSGNGCTVSKRVKTNGKKLQAGPKNNS